MIVDEKKLLANLFDKAIQAALPQNCLAQYLPPKPKGRTIIIGAGKGSAQLAQTLEKLWAAPLEGLVVTRYGFGATCRNIEIIEAAHPVPDRAGLIASHRLLKLMSELNEDDLVIALISGGGSALLPSPPAGLSLDDEMKLNEALLRSGAPISVMNNIRIELSTIKGGRLAYLAAPAKVVSLIVSDIPGDNPAFVASGPTIASASSAEKAIKDIGLYNIDLPQHIIDYLASGKNKAPKPDDIAFANNEQYVIASAKISLEAAADYAGEMGVSAVILSAAMEGEARELAKFHAYVAKEVVANNRPFKRPIILLSGGEATVTIKGDGKGGPNAEFALSFAINIVGSKNIHALFADSDGIDGSENNAGAFVNTETFKRIIEKGYNPAELLRNNNSYKAFNAISELFITGPSGTNVNDFRAILIK